jgi:hypothetical protein
VTTEAAEATATPGPQPAARPGPRAFADLGGEARWHGLLDAFDAAVPEPLMQAWQRLIQARQAAAAPVPEPEPPLPGLPPGQDAAMGRFDSAHDDDTAIASPPAASEPGRPRHRLLAALGRRLRRRERPYRARERDVYPLAAPPPPLAPPVPAPAEVTAWDHMPVPPWLGGSYPQAARHARGPSWPG